MFLVCHRFYSLGFVMAHPRVHRPEDDVKPIVSNYWPIMLLIFVFISPSSNWDQAGNLVYPYWPRTTDRLLYVTGSFATVFFIDRWGRWAALANNIKPILLQIAWT